MYEKISDISVREQKIEKLRSKIIAEIEKHSKRNHEFMKQCLSNNQINQEDWRQIISEEFSLLKLGDYLNSPGLFQSFEARYDDKNIIIYQISDESLNIWLQENYNFTQNFLFEVGKREFDVFALLNDRFFGYEFTSVFDVLNYRDKK